MSVQPVQQKIKFPMLDGILKIDQLNISSAPQILNKQVGELLSEGELISCKDLDIGSPLAFLVNESLFFHNTCQNPAISSSPQASVEPIYMWRILEY